MDIILNRETFQRALGLVEHATTRNASLPALSHVLLSAEGQQVTLSATNLEVGVSLRIAGKIVKPGKVVVPARVLYDFVRASKGDSIALATDKGSLKASIGRARTSLVTFDVAEYPIIPTITKTTAYTIPANELCGLMAGVLDCVATSDSRPELSGALIRFEPTTAVAAATDSFRLAERTTQRTHSTRASIIIPRAGVTEVLRVFAEADGDVEVRIGDNQVAFSDGNAEIVSRVIDGKYPDYQRVIPERALARVVVSKEELEEAVRVAALFSSSISDVKLEYTKNTIAISGRSAHRGEAHATIDATGNGEPFEVTMNCHYLVDGLKAMPGEKVVLEFTGKGSAFVLRPERSDAGAVYLIMPLRA